MLNCIVELSDVKMYIVVLEMDTVQVLLARLKKRQRDSAFGVPNIRKYVSKEEEPNKHIRAKLVEVFQVYQEAFVEFGLNPQNNTGTF